MWIKETVKKLTTTYKTNDPFEIASAKNIIVFEKDMHEEIMGFYKYIRRNKFIFVNANLNDDTKIFTCAHELGHSQLHPGISTPFLRRNTLYSIDKIEQEANRFAVELLMLDEDLYQLNDTNLTIYDAAALYGIPDDVAHLKKY
ncbi:ImmA/IrrE family metallo-endopeptidase [Bacillaceae bacterium SIJ1]|uniref:ImmA/IrrE family metallo-endopeptidase n=1 Tax=Litoribacterium kuwaitense TaxID=1398745 RepID=UPI0013EB9D35|nr:ImmA/IrrE family metallo-endopeptidase [Litoribacterium kuwaitense]NGP46018.1 ImmA/IrrE family metallo-endopeptidase [Litoribacterium kuwaitense]